MKKIITILIIVALVSGSFLLFMRAQQAKENTPLPKPPAWRVAVIKAKQLQVGQKSTFLARLDARNSASIASKLTGKISHLSVKESQRVAKGELLLAIDDKEIKASIEGLQATLASAKSQRDYNKKLLVRNRNLFKAHTISQDKFELSQVAYSTAKAQVEELKQRLQGLQNQLDYALITAPFDGIVGNIFMREGDLTIPGKTILKLNALSQKLTFSFTPNSLNNAVNIQLGQDVLWSNKKIGEISTLYNDANAGLWVAEIALTQTIEQPMGSYLTIEVITKKAQGCAIPLRALLHRKDQQSVMVYKHKIFTEQQVKVIAEDDNYAVIKPCVTQPVAIGAESKLALLPALGENVSIRSENNE